MSTAMEGPSQRFADHGAWEYEPASGRASWSDAMYRIFGVGRDEFDPSREHLAELVDAADRGTVTEVVRDAIESRTPFACQFRIRRPDGEVRVLVVRGSYVEGADGGTDRLIGTAQDLTDSEGEEKRLWHLANHDSLSGLFNRARFMEELERELAYTARYGTPGAVLLLDIDHFKDVNDSLGHMAGDELLARVAEALKDRLRDTDTLARLGGDEFAVVLPTCDVQQAEKVAADLLASLRRHATVKMGGAERRVTASVGIASFGAAAGTAESLLVEADLAMYRAKRTGRDRVEVFDVEMRAELAARVSTEGELREALGGQELCVQYQPIVSLAGGAVVGCEALVRWEHPLRGMVGPDDFVSIAEETGLIGRLGRFVLERACLQAAEWRRDGHDVHVSVNVSPLQLAASDVVDDVISALNRSGLHAPLLCLEITETTLLHDSSPVLTTLGRLRSLGVRIALDDFGGGTSSLGLLRLLPIDQIKIDRMFIAGIAEHSNDRAIVAAVISLAKELGISVVAEGVETQRQQDELCELGAQYAQGFLYSPARHPGELDLRAPLRSTVPGIVDAS